MTASALILLPAGLVLLVTGAELLVRGASRLAAALGIPQLVIGLTVVAYGTSAPEFAVSVRSALAGQADLALGNVVGSNIFNVLVILGISALATPLVVSRRVVRLDVPIMVAASLLLLLLAMDGGIGRGEGTLLLAGIAGYTLFLLRWQGNDETDTAGPAERPVPARTPAVLRQGTIAAVGLVLLVIGSRWLVAGATAIADAWGISDLVIGLTVVAAGTSLPELATSVVATIRGQRDIAVGNVVGSNIFNILAVLGASALVAPAALRVAPAALAFDVPVMIGVAVACMPILFRTHRIGRWQGALFLGWFAAYTIHLVMHAANPPVLPAFRTVMAVLVLPLTAVTLLAEVSRRRSPG
ncbi:MAG TPA: calcium/sodium antiporter [Longimicrobiales bacterium]|nr:calcium/sodium antiporter [Longimicrobiales bacterium]